MELMSITSVRPGQVLAKAVTNAGGAVLCPAGFRLTEAVLERLRNGNIQSVLVEGGHRTGATPRERLIALEQRFAGVDDPILMQLKAAIEGRLNLMAIEQEAAE